MSSYLIIEITIFVVWLAIFLISFIKKDSPSLLALLVPLPIAIVLEVMNEVVFQGEGTYYPGTLVAFPGFSFPVAIILLSSLFAFFVCFVLSRFKKSMIVKLLLLAVLTLLFFPVEMLFTAVEYWKYNMPPNNIVYLFMYLYYAVIVWPVCLIAGMQKKRQQ
ncbi:hypothetical protein KAH37_07720 [bacterium]|nr:hypothetical protein [bacterium]